MRDIEVRMNGAGERATRMQADLLRYGVMTIACLALAGCGWSETFVSFGGKAGGQPVFCVSSKPNCARPGTALRALEVDEIDADGRTIRAMWKIGSLSKSGSAYSVDKIAYGTAPVGWATKTAAVALEPGRHYAVNKQFYFSITNNGLVAVDDKP